MEMKSFFERLQINIKNEPNRVILRSEGCPDGITYKQLDEASGRVCRFLKDRNIGREDFVVILMPREVSAYISVIGAWKSGAAIILLEEDYSPERVDYIKADVGCKLAITRDVFNEMMKCEPCTGYTIPDKHDSCFAVYTSGSTGNPKGVLHEFGKLDYLGYSNSKISDVPNDAVFALASPLNFVASIRNAMRVLLIRECLYICPYNMAQNKELFLKFIADNNISEIFLTPSYAKTIDKFPSCLCNVFLGGEPCNSKVAKNSANISNYSTSEVVFPISSFLIEKEYDVAPVGVANENVKVKVLKEDGSEAKAFELGEIIVENPYTRGYINLPSKTEEAFHNGFFYTGDLGYYDENNIFYICGRKDDMIKINGNRIEPMEIEANIKNILKVKNVLAKGFVDDKRSFVAVYLLKDELFEKCLLDDNGDLIFSASEMKNKLQSRLPDYMIPSYYIVIEAYPKNNNGKLSRKDLPKPIAEDYLKGYEPPNNEVEEYFCRLFENALGLDKVSVNDDFYQIGGDSISSINAITQCDRFNLTITDIYNARTPRALSKIVLKSAERYSLQSQNEKALAFPQPLLPEQQATFEGQMEFPDLILHNLTRFYKLSKKIDIDKFKSAVDKVLRHHPVFSSVLINDNGIEKLYYKPELFKGTEVKSISQAELKKIISEPCRVFQLENTLLYRHRIYKCEGEAYFFLEIHHLITDGTSLKLLTDEISRCYHNDAEALNEDYFFLVLQKNAAKANHVTPQKIREMYHVNDFMCKDDNSIRRERRFVELLPSKYEAVLNVEKDKILQSNSYEKYKGNVFFLTCFLKAMSEYNKRNKAFAFWTYNGREQKYEQNVHGILIRTMPMGIEFEPQTDIKNIFETVKNTIDKQLAAEIEFIKGFTDDFMFSPYFIYQKDIMYLKNAKGVFDEEIELPSGAVVFEFHLIDNSDENRFRCKVKYSAGVYDKKSIEDFCKLFETTVKQTLDD